jgi:hypothetical protein
MTAAPPDPETPDPPRTAETASAAGAPSTAAEERRLRLAEALRDNLRRRKAQARARRAPTPSHEGRSVDIPEDDAQG